MTFSIFQKAFDFEQNKCKVTLGSSIKQKVKIFVGLQLNKLLCIIALHRSFYPLLTAIRIVENWLSIYCYAKCFVRALIWLLSNFFHPLALK